MLRQAEKPFADTVHKSALLTKQQAAAQLQVTTRYIERMVASGRLRAYKTTGGLLRIRQSALDNFLESGASIAA
jgi:excisionase family DNA binding protein